MDKATSMLNSLWEVCAECEQTAASSSALSRSGARLCAACVAAYYVACSVCRKLTARDESLSREELLCCLECFSAPAATESLDEAAVETLVAEYVALQAEEKRISEQLEAIKERLKAAASGKPREGSSVTLRAADAAAAVRCSYRTTLKCDADALPLLEQLLAEDEFAALFERKVSVTPVKERVAGFLADADDARGEARAILRAALRETETVTLSVVGGSRKR
ncbi:MAG: hypothetical protein WKF30_08895 [Pyrinomonadaceae bacterium]